MRLLIDSDPGIDDALALLLAFASPGVTVEAITTVAGNVDLELATANALRILHVADPAPAPRVARGAAQPLAGPLVTAAHVHGDDGLGGLNARLDPDGRPRYPAAAVALEMQDGPDLILDLARAQGPDLVVVALGPLTNLALALRRDPEALARVGRVVIMGGAIGVPGNVTPAAEFNFYVDPEAADAVFAANLPLELVPLDVTRQVLLREADLAGGQGGAPSAVAAFVRDLTRHGFEFARSEDDAGITLHDPLAVAVALDPSLVSFEPLSVSVECQGRHTRGLALADRRPRRWRPRPNCRVAMAVDAPRVLDLFRERVCPTSSSSAR
jgi:purine nucleosidase/pyrimidine-specific ribonucleoside hydrolase